MASNGVNSAEVFAWRFGFANSENKWLTAEKFGYKLNASATALKAKQVWMLEYGPSTDEVYVKSSQKRYLATDKYGNLTCDTEEPGDANRFILEYGADGKWAFKSAVFTSYMGGTGDQLHCKSKTAEFWAVQLAIHPQVNLYNSNRKTYCHLAETGAEDELPTEVHATREVPWGSSALITLKYVSSQGKYAIQMSDGRYILPDGSLNFNLVDDACYTLQLKSGGLAFKSRDGKFLTNVGSNAVLKVRGTKISKDELFVIRDSKPQVVLLGSNGKRASIMQGIDVSANQDDDTVSEKDIFQLEFDIPSKKWKFLASNGKYWVQQGVGIQAAGEGSEASKRGPARNKGGPEASLFDLEQLDNSRVAIKAPNGKYITIKMTGALNASCDTLGDKEKFLMKIMNRPFVILKGEFGFLGMKAMTKKVEANRAAYDTFNMQQRDDGLYVFQEPESKKYWSLDGGQVICMAEEGEATGFQLELLGDTKLAVKSPDGKYLRGENSGMLSASGSEIKADTKYEF